MESDIDTFVSLDEAMRRALAAASERKRWYEVKHPETKHGENQHTRSCQVGDSTPAPRFTADTAAKIGTEARS